MKILVTGGAGYIGSHTVLELLNQGHDVLIYDNLINSDETVLTGLERISGKSIKFICGDVRENLKLKTAMKDFLPDVVIHFAALKCIAESFEKPNEYYDVNISGTLSLLMAMDYCDCRYILFSSSAAVYGHPHYVPIDEGHPTDPTNPYGKSKLMVEKILADWVKSSLCRSATCLRYFNPIGAHETGLIGEKLTSSPNNILPYITQVAVGKLPYVGVFGDDYETRDGTGERDFIHVSDLAAFHVCALNKRSDLDKFQILNVGTGKNTTVLELIRTFERSSGQKIRYIVEERREGDVASCWANTQLAERKLNFKAQKSILKACADTWNRETLHFNEI
jgi:UDP-glucose 4-epimerase